MSVKKQNSLLNFSRILTSKLLSQHKPLYVNFCLNKIIIIKINLKNAAYTNMPGLQQEMHRTYRKAFSYKILEYFRDYKYENNKSKFAQHLLDNKHSIGPMLNIMNIICITSKGKKIPWKNSAFIKKQGSTTK